MRLYLIRHGESEANLGRYTSGHMDVCLTENGVQQAKRLAEKLSRIDLAAVYSSDLKRAMHTAREVLAGRDLELRTSENLRERHFGEWEGLTFKHIEERYPVEWTEFLNKGFNAAVPGGEPIEALYSRTLGEVNRIVEEHGMDSKANVCIVVHGCVLMALLSHFAFGDLSGYNKFIFDNAKINVVEFMAGYPVIRAINA